ncbi:MAG: prenyltransferase [bacterium]|nr:prenyltransferase [bacterium]
MPEDPWLRRFAGWIDERFPPVQGVLFFALYALALVAGRSLARPGVLAVSSRDLVGFLAFYAFFFMLRIFDEHKDYELDCRNYPQRVLQRGLISLNELKVLCAGAIAVQGGVSLWLDGELGPITRTWLLVMAWSLLMAVEFFVGRWLKAHLLLYAATHMLVMPLAVAWVATMGAAAGPPSAELGLLGALAFVSGFVFEVGRKIKAPEEERATVDSYSKLFGPRGVAWLMIALLGAVTVLLAGLLYRAAGDAMGRFWPAALGALFLLGTVPCLRFSLRPTSERAKRLGAAASGVAMGGYLVFIAVLIAVWGLRWT